MEEKKSDKSTQIVHEAELTRQHARYKIPATIEIEGKKYKVFDWSVSGAGIEDIPEELYEKRHAVAKMIFKFDDFETVIDNLNLEFVTKRPNNVVGARFTELTPQQISILNQIISAYLAGDIITEDDIIHAVTRANFSQKKEKKEKVDKKKPILVLLLLWTFILFLICFLLYVMYKRIYIIKSENAFFDTNITIIRAPSPSYIEFAKNFKPNDEINVSEPLMYAHLMYGGVKIVKSPLDGIIYKTIIHNGDFRNVGEPVFAVLDKNYSVYIKASILHKDMIKVKIGDIAKVTLPNGENFYAKITNITFPYNVLEQHSRPLENVYNQARNYDKVILKPLNYKVPKNLLGTSASVTIDTLLNKYDWYSIENNSTKEEKNETVEKNQTTQIQNEINETNETELMVEKNTTDNNITNNSITIEENQTIITEKNTSTENITNTNIPIVEETDINKTNVENDEKNIPVVKTNEKKYCIIAASSTKQFEGPKSKEFLSKFNKAKVVKVGNIYEIKLSYYNTYNDVKSALDNQVKKYYKDAFIIRCKEEK